MDLIDKFTQRLTHSETSICRCNYCMETQAILKELLDEVEKRIWAEIDHYDGGDLKAAFAKMRRES